MTMIVLKFSKSSAHQISKRETTADLAVWLLLSVDNCLYKTIAVITFLSNRGKSFPIVLYTLIGLVQIELDIMRSPRGPVNVPGAEIRKRC